MNKRLYIKLLAQTLLATILLISSSIHLIDRRMRSRAREAAAAERTWDAQAASRRAQASIEQRHAQARALGLAIQNALATNAGGGGELARRTAQATLERHPHIRRARCVVNIPTADGGQRFMVAHCEPGTFALEPAPDSAAAWAMALLDAPERRQPWSDAPDTTLRVDATLWSGHTYLGAATLWADPLPAAPGGGRILGPDLHPMASAGATTNHDANDALAAALAAAAEQGKPRAHWHDNANLTIAVPFRIDNSGATYLYVSDIDKKQLDSGLTGRIGPAAYAGALGVAVIGLMIAFVVIIVTRALTPITAALQRVAQGDIDPRNRVRWHGSPDEIADMSHAVNRLIDGLNGISRFASEMGAGNLEARYQPLGPHDILGQSLDDMRGSLIASRDEEERQRAQDAKQSWVTQGISLFGEILRRDNDDLKKLTLNIARNICEYMSVPQCALFVAKEGDHSDEVELVAAYAYGNEKSIEKSVAKDEELIGRVLREARPLVYDNLPPTFPVVVPELADAPRPTSLMLAPIMAADDVLGVLELMSDSPFEEHQKEFVEKLGANIASTIRSVKINVKTADLLQQSHDQKNILAQHEEEMRQNLEEMLATQEEAEKRDNELRGVIAALERSVLLALLGPEGRVIRINPALADIYGTPPAQMIGKYFEAFSNADEAGRKELAQLWAETMAGNIQKRIHKLDRAQRAVYLSETFVPIVGPDRETVERVVVVAADITQKIEYDREIAHLVDEMNQYTT